MYSLQIADIINRNLVHAFSWTLIHSLWQGLFLAIIAGLVIMRTRKTGSAIRYSILTGLFGLFLLASLGTFIREWEISDQQQQVASVIQVDGTIHSGTEWMKQEDGIVVSANSRDFIDTVVVYFNTHASLVVLAWLIIFSARCVKMMANMHYIRRIKTQKISTPPDFWKMRIRELAKSLGIDRPVTLLESKLVKVPVMVGLIKPVILFPFALLAQLPADQVEAVLLHELAHIRRRDYFVNLLQHFAETIFFFNPGLLWLSSLIRDERENCCDDIAIGQTRSKKQFIHALVAFQEYHLSAPRYATAFPGNRDHLLQRVKRILNNDNKTLDMREKLFLVVCLAIVGFFTIAYSQSHKKPTVPVTPVSKVTPVTDTVPPVFVLKDSITGPGYTIYDKKGFQIVTKDDSIMSVYLKGKKMSSQQIEDMRPLIDEVLAASKKDADELNRNELQLAMAGQNLQLQQEKKMAELDRLSQNQAELNEQREKMMADNALRLQDLAASGKNNDALLYDKQKMDQEKMLLDAMKTRKVQEEMLQLNAQNQDLQNALLNLQLADTLQLNLKSLPEIRQKQIQLEKKLLLLNAEKSKLSLVQKQSAELNYDLEKLKQEQVMLKLRDEQLQQLKTNDMKQWNRSRDKYIEPIINELLDRKIISNREVISFSLDKKSFTVNGVKQPESIRKSFQEQFLVSPDSRINYSFKKGSESMQVNDGN